MLLILGHTRSQSLAVNQGAFPHVRFLLRPVRQDVDMGHLKAVDVVLELEDLMGKLDFLRAGYDEVSCTFLKGCSFMAKAAKHNEAD